MFLKFILGALRYRRQRLALAFAALAVAATLSTVLFGIYGTIEQRIRDEFRSYGANIVAVPINGKTVPRELAATAERLGAEAAPFLVSSGRIGEDAVPVAGFDVAKSRSLTSFWHMQGTRDIAAGECIAGEILAARLNLRVGSSAGSCTVRGIVSTGGAEDSELLVPFDAAAGVASFVEIRAPGDKIEVVRTALAQQFPTADVRTIVAVASTESNVVLKIRAALFLLTLLILVITTLCVSSNFSEMVLERSKEIGILKALGAAERRIAALFVSESAALAVLAALVGYAAGVFAAAGIGRQVFGGSYHVELSWLVCAGVTLVMLLIAAVATGISASRIWGIQPAIILRGE